MVSVTHTQAQKVMPPCRVMNMEACSWELITFLVAIWIGKKIKTCLNACFKAKRDGGMVIRGETGRDLWEEGNYLAKHRYENGVWNSQGEVLLQVAAVPQQPRPQLHADDAEDEEDEEAEQQHVAEHGQRVEQQVHQDAHACVHRK